MEGNSVSCEEVDGYTKKHCFEGCIESAFPSLLTVLEEIFSFQTEDPGIVAPGLRQKPSPVPSMFIFQGSGFGQSHWAAQH